LEPLLQSEILHVEAVILASYDRWKQFQTKLSGIPAAASLREDWAFRRRSKLIQKKIRALSRANVRIVFDVNDPENVRHALQYDLVVCAAYPQIFRAALLSAPKQGAINFHPSYLPRCRGAHPVYWTIASEEPCGGVSCHFMEKTIDTGALLAQRRIAFDKNNITYDDLYRLVEGETPRLCGDVEKFFAEGREEIPQRGAPSYFKNEKEEDRKVLFANETVERASAKVRAGGAFALCNSGLRVLLGPPASVSAPPNQRSNVAQGELVAVDSERIVVAGQNGYLSCRYWIASQTSRLRRGLRRLQLASNLETGALRVGERLR
jgi:methionyl-tRNA formyltransferase